MASNGIPFTRAAARGKSLPVGFRFHPTEEELIGHYLQLKLRGMDSLVSDVICEINMCNHEPWDLREKSLIKSDDEEWYFYNRPIYKKNSRNDTERAMKEGFWKITGPVKEVRARDNKTIGKKRILTFYRRRSHDGRRNDQITPWVMHEFYIPQISPNANQRDFVLCHVKKKSGKNTDVATCDEGECSNHNNAPDFENQPQPPHNVGVEEEHNQPPQNLDIFQRYMHSILVNAHDNNDYHGMQSALAANERDENSDEEFANTLIVDPYQDSSEEMTHTNVFNDSTRPESPRKVYLEDCGVSSYSDTKVPHARGVAQEHNQPPQNVDIFQRHMDNLLADARGNKDYHGMDENSEEFVNGFFADDLYQDYSEEITRDNVFNDSTMPQSPRKVYLKDCGVSSDSDTEVQHRAAEGLSLQMLGVPQASSSHSRREEGVMLRNQTLRQAASSINVLPKPQIDRLQSVSDEDSGTNQITSRLQSASNNNQSVMKIILSLIMLHARLYFHQKGCGVVSHKPLLAMHAERICRICRKCV